MTDIEISLLLLVASLVFKNAAEQVQKNEDASISDLIGAIFCLLLALICIVAAVSRLFISLFN